ncbi:MAG: Asp-tRNA(Asn)/Glu-tRNA(Gln) amidotransferase subunit GatB [Phycisphaerae bacterium]|jgi:aspartyl-tRNA(Asn)/glutamyl-tRNA(Gln) amidotransferase subunit B|nr:Asp-tRNA(Asn)/Glu-tRNA(Gln) amidotransferase subunit GatB [Phycisphaerae bacterium]
MTAAHHNATIVRTQLKIGLEIHVELATRTKMFTRVANAAHPSNFDAEPNSLVDPVVAALPGVLPVMNRRAVEMSIMVGLALNCSIARYSKWDRKNYYYPDLPKGYQISQYDLPLCGDGAIDIPTAQETKRIGIIRAHLEEDTGKLGHELPGGRHYAGSLVDLNRAGTPLLEIVTAPDFDSADDVVTFARELRNICRFLGVTEGIMQKGHMRFEPNVNVIIETSDGHHIATPIVEVKNLNSFKAVKGAIEFEERRQIDEWMKTGKVMGRGAKSTRGWDDVNLVTVLQREKEDAHDYRYFPDPDLVPVVVDSSWLESIRSGLPELPIQRKRRYMEDYNLPPKDAQSLVEERDVAFLLDEATRLAVLAGGFASEPDAGYAIGKLLLNNISKRANELNRAIDELGLSARQVSEIAIIKEKGEIAAQQVDPLLVALTERPDQSVGARETAERLGLIQVRDEGQLDAWCAAAIEAQPQAAADLAAGKEAAIGRLVGHVMKLSGGKVDAKSVQQKLRERVGRS